MINKNPPFEITNTVVTLVADIGELTGRFTANHGLPMSPTLRRSNRIRTIHASLAIEQNSLSIEQITAILSGKRVIAPPKDIAEVKNAYEIYEHMDSLNPYDMDDLLVAHGIMMRERLNIIQNLDLEFQSHRFLALIMRILKNLLLYLSFFVNLKV